MDFHATLSPYFKLEQVENRVTLLRDIEDTLLRQIHVIPLYRNKQQVTSHEKVQNIMINSQGWIDFIKYGLNPDKKVLTHSLQEV